VFLLVVKISLGEDFVRRSGPEIILRIHVILVLLWSLAFSRKLSDALRSSPVVENRINKVYSSEPSWALRRKCILWTILYIFLSVALTLKTFLVDIFLNTKMSSVQEIWEKYGEDTCALSTMFPSSLSGAYCVIMELATHFLWTFGDFLLILVALTLVHLFTQINTNGIQKIEPRSLSSIEIDLVREHHGLVCKLVKDFDDAISSLNFINVVFNTAFILLAIYSIVSLRRGEQRFNSSRIINLSCKIGVAIFKLLAGLISASILHHRAHEGLSEIRSWPMAREFNDFSLNNGRASVVRR
jgi:hypothetical protein